MQYVSNLVAKNPIQISGALVAVLNFLILMDWIDMTADQVAAANVALIAVLGLFVGANTVNTAKLDELAGDDEPPL